MTKPEKLEGHDINLTKEIRAPRSKVYEALTDSAIAQKWWCSPPWQFTNLTLDAKPGGKFIYAIENTEGDGAYSTQGEYREAVPNERLVWTNEEGGGTLVTVTLSDTPAGAEIRVNQGAFPDEATRDDHAQGWSGCLDQMAALLEG